MHTLERFFTSSLVCAPKAAPKLFGYGPCFNVRVLILHLLHLLFGDKGEGGGIVFFLSLARLQELAGSLVSV